MHETALNATIAFPIYVVNVEVVLPAIQEAVFFQAWVPLSNESTKRWTESTATSRRTIKVPITPKIFFRFLKSLHGIRKNAAKIFAIG